MIATHRSRRSPLLAILAVPMIALALAACSPDGGSPDPSESPQADGLTAPRSAADWQVDYAACMRDEGIDMPDPSADGSASATKVDDVDAMDAAIEVCIGKLGEAPVPEGTLSNEEVLDDQLETVACLRENGLDVPDPVPGTAMTIPEGASADVLAECGLPNLGD